MEEEYISIKDVWIAAGGNPDIEISKEDLFTLIKMLNDCVDEQSDTIKELKDGLKNLNYTSSFVANCAYNIGQRHEDWDNIRGYISKLDEARIQAGKLIKGE